MRARKAFEAIDAPHKSFDPCNQFAHVKRLRDVIIGPKSEAHDFVHSFRAGGKHQNRSIVVPSSQFPANFETVDPRQHEIERQEVILPGVCGTKSRFAVAHRLDVITFRPEAVP
jgi:hypothetical protein